MRISREVLDRYTAALDAVSGALREKMAADLAKVPLDDIPLARQLMADIMERYAGAGETLAADIPLAVDHFRYFAGAIRAQVGSAGEFDDDTVA